MPPPPGAGLGIPEWTPRAPSDATPSFGLGGIGYSARAPPRSPWFSPYLFRAVRRSAVPGRARLSVCSPVSRPTAGMPRGNRAPTEIFCLTGPASSLACTCNEYVYWS